MKEEDRMKKEKNNVEKKNGRERRKRGYVKKKEKEKFERLLKEEKHKNECNGIEGECSCE